MNSRHREELQKPVRTTEQMDIGSSKHDEDVHQYGRAMGPGFQSGNVLMSSSSVKDSQHRDDEMKIEGRVTSGVKEV